MPLYRKHRGSLSDSLLTTVIVKNIEELKKVILLDWDAWIDVEGSHVDNVKGFIVKVNPYGHLDIRCGWYTHLVSADLMIKNEFMPVGFLSEPFGD